jgi:hypothetical protein
LLTASLIAVVLPVSGCASVPEEAAETGPVATSALSAQVEAKHDEAAPSPVAPPVGLSSWLATVPVNVRDVFSLSEGVGPKAPADYNTAVRRLRDTPAESVRTLRRLYETAPADTHLARWKIVQVTTSLSLPESLDFLKSVATSALPADNVVLANAHESTPRAEEDMIRARAIVGISRLAQQGVSGAVQALEDLLTSNSREIVISAAMELDLLGKLGTQHHALLKAKGLKTKFERTNDSVFNLKPERAKPEGSDKPLDPEPQRWDANN